jgi:hypothetical protein
MLLSPEGFFLESEKGLLQVPQVGYNETLTFWLTWTRGDIEIIWVSSDFN